MQRSSFSFFPSFLPFFPSFSYYFLLLPISNSLSYPFFFSSYMAFPSSSIVSPSLRFSHFSFNCMRAVVTTPTSDVPFLLFARIVDAEEGRRELLRHHEHRTLYVSRRQHTSN